MREGMERWLCQESFSDSTLPTWGHLITDFCPSPHLFFIYSLQGTSRGVVEKWSVQDMEYLRALFMQIYTTSKPIRASLLCNVQLILPKQPNEVQKIHPAGSCPLLVASAWETLHWVGTNSDAGFHGNQLLPSHSLSRVDRCLRYLRCLTETPFFEPGTSPPCNSKT